MFSWVGSLRLRLGRGRLAAGGSHGYGAGMRWFLTLSAGCSEVGFADPSRLDAVPSAAKPVNVEVVDSFVQVTEPSVDVLWVVDNSCSMDDEQDAIAVNFPVFIEWFVSSGLLFHIGVVSTDMEDPTQSGQLQAAQGVKWIDPATPFPESVFDDMARLGVSGDSAEMGRAAAYTAIELKGQTQNAGFIREEARLAIIVLSDEVDHSGDVPIGLEEWIDYLYDLKRAPSMVGVHSIVGPPGGCGLEAEEGSGYIEVTEALGGVLTPICTEDWAAVLGEIGETVANPSQEYFLSEIPIVESIEVAADIDGAHVVFTPETQWTYQPARNSVLLTDFEVEPLTPVSVTYEAIGPSELIE